MKIKKILSIICGCFIYSLGISLFLSPNAIAPGGITGISIILSQVRGLSTSRWYFLLNIPIVLYGLYKFGGKMIGFSVFSVVLNTIFTNYLSKITPLTTDTLMATIIGSMLVGVGLGLVLRVGATTGGIDIIIKGIRQKYPEIKTSSLYVIFDAIVVAMVGIVFRDFNLAVYALIAVMVNGKVMDYMLYGNGDARFVYIISDFSEMLLEKIIDEMEIGATIISGKGGYSKENKEIILCVVKKRRVYELRELVKVIDTNAFFIITSASEIYGEGYRNIEQEQI